MTQSHGFERVTAAVATELGVPAAIADRIVGENLETLRSRRIPAAVAAFGYAGAQGHDLTLVAGGSSIASLRVSCASIAEIEAHRAAGRA